MTKTFLKIKIKSLAAEAGIIRAEERKWPRAGMTGTRFALAQHRRFDVRREARSALLAYGFLRGRSYERIEAKCWDAPDLIRTAEIVAKFGGAPKAQALEEVRAWAATKWVGHALVPRAAELARAA